MDTIELNVAIDTSVNFEYKLNVHIWVCVDDAYIFTQCCENAIIVRQFVLRIEWVCESRKRCRQTNANLNLHT